MSVYHVSASECNSAPAGHEQSLIEGPAPIAGGVGPHASSTDQASEKAVWWAWAGDLADWALAKVFVRTDCYGSYWWKPTAEGLEVEAITVKHIPTRDRLIRHFSGEAPEDRVGAHLVSPRDETCKITVVDIDAHGPDDDPVANWAFAKIVAR